MEKMRLVQFQIVSILVLTVLAGSASQGQTATPSPTPNPAPTSSDIFIVDVRRQDGELALGQPKKITEVAGYNNQPFFMPNGQAILYTSIRNKQADIYR